MIRVGQVWRLRREKYPTNAKLPVGDETLLLVLATAVKLEERRQGEWTTHFQVQVLDLEGGGGEVRWMPLCSYLDDRLGRRIRCELVDDAAG